MLSSTEWVLWGSKAARQVHPVSRSSDILLSLRRGFFEFRQLLFPFEDSILSIGFSIELHQESKGRFQTRLPTVGAIWFNLVLPLLHAFITRKEQRFGLS